MSATVTAEKATPPAPTPSAAMADWTIMPSTEVSGIPPGRSLKDPRSWRRVRAAATSPDRAWNSESSRRPAA